METGGQNALKLLHFVLKLLSCKTGLVNLTAFQLYTFVRHCVVSFNMHLQINKLN